MLLRFSPSFNKSIAKKVIMMPKMVIPPVSIYPIRRAYFIDLNELRSYCEHAGRYPIIFSPSFLFFQSLSVKRFLKGTRESQMYIPSHTN